MRQRHLSTASSRRPRPIGYLGRRELAPKKDGGGTSVIAWVKNFGPMGGGGSKEETVFYYFSHGQCQDALDTARNTTFTPDENGEIPLPGPLRSLYVAASSACLAAFHKDGDLWKQAEQNYEQARVNRIGYTCGDQQVFLALESIITAYRSGVRTFSQKAGGSVCPILESTTPSHGNRAGGYEITLRGTNLTEGDFFYWCGKIMRIGKTDGKSFRAIVPPRSHLGDSCDHVDLRMKNGYPIRWEAFFDYDS